MSLSLFLLTRNSGAGRKFGFDYVNEMVVVAPTAKAAREIAGDNSLDEGAICWNSPRGSRCERLGTARDSMKQPRVILREVTWTEG